MIESEHEKKQTRMILIGDLKIFQLAYSVNSFESTFTKESVP